MGEEMVLEIIEDKIKVVFAEIKINIIEDDFKIKIKGDITTCNNKIEDQTKTKVGIKVDKTTKRFCAGISKELVIANTEINVLMHMDNKI